MELIQLVQNDINVFLKNNDRLFLNERDFQMHLTVWLKHSAHAYDDVDVEYYVPYKILDNYIWENELHLDIVVRKNGEYLPVELKYKTKNVQLIKLRYSYEIRYKKCSYFFGCRYLG